MTAPNPRPHVLVTGAARPRIGRAIANSLAEAGYTVLAQTRRCESSYREGLHERVVVLDHSIDSPEAARSLISSAAARAVADCGWLAGVVANAAAFDYDLPTSRSDHCLTEHMRINLVSPLAAWRELLHQHETYTSLVGGECLPAFYTVILDQVVRNPNTDYFSYAISKGAWTGVLRQLAVCGAPFVRTNAILPGLVLPGGAMTAEAFSRQHAQTPLRIGPTPEDIAGACEFFARSRAVSGEEIAVDGGRHFAPSFRDPAFIPC
mgnify:CR=1 FL=1